MNNLKGQINKTLSIEKMNKEKLIIHLEEIIRETREFQYQNWNEKNYLLELPHKWEYSIFSKLKGELVGFSINSQKSNSLYIHYFFVFTAHRSKNVGESMIEECINIAKQNDIPGITLKCHIENYNAINFYMKFGFCITGIELSNNLYIMQKELKI